jgi:uncharacterized protein (DUF58 family)
MLPENVLKKIKEIELTATKLSTSVVVGKHLSTFKGNGLDFADLREYQTGDDVRNIAWRQSIRSGRTFVKSYTEERNLNILLVLDISLSGNFGSYDKFNAEAAAELAATIAMSAMKSGDNVGVALFSEDIELYVPPGKGKLHISRIIREILYFHPKSARTDLRVALKKLALLAPKSSHVFLMTDIHSDTSFPELKVFAKQHELNLITIYDTTERRLPDIGNLEINDIETNENMIINTSSSSLRLTYEKEMNRLFEKRKKELNLIGVRNGFINNKSNLFLEIIKFYSAGKRA